jgi:hypothetical protein
MSEAVSSKKSKAGKRWLGLATRIVVAMVIFIAAVGFILSLAGIVGIWVAFAPARGAVTDVAATTTHALESVDNGLGRVNTPVQDARQTLTRVNDEAAKLGNRIQANSPVVSALSQRVDNDLAPRIENARTTAFAIHDHESDSQDRCAAGADSSDGQQISSDGDARAGPGCVDPRYDSPADYDVCSGFDSHPGRLCGGTSAADVCLLAVCAHRTFSIPARDAHIALIHPNLYRPEHVMCARWH